MGHKQAESNVPRSLLRGVSRISSMGFNKVYVRRYSIEKELEKDTEYLWEDFLQAMVLLLKKVPAEKRKELIDVLLTIDVEQCAKENMLMSHELLGDQKK